VIDMSQFRRHRRLRRTPYLRDLVREHRVHADDLVYPMFVEEGLRGTSPIQSMPGVSRYGLDALRREITSLSELGLKSVILFGIPREKDEFSSSAYHEHGVVQEAIRAIKAENPDLVVITDVCLCEYNPLGQCGLVRDGKIVNDPTLELLAKTAVSHAQAGADIVAPSDMMDGRVAAIREALDAHGYEDVIVLSYAVKYASSFYGPFREAADSAPQFGDRKSYQMDPANGREAMREARSDLEEGADMLMVKPALAYMDVTARLRAALDVPIATYNVSGEYSMVKAAAQHGWIDEKAVVMEMMTSFKRAGADLILTYHAPDVLRWLREEER